MEKDSTFTYVHGDRVRIPESPLGNNALAAAGLSKA